MKNRSKFLVLFFIFGISVVHAETESLCVNPDLLSTLYYVKFVVGIICTIAPIVLIVKLMLSLAKTIVTDEKLEIKNYVNKIVLCVCIYIVPTIISMLMGLVGNTTFSECYSGATIDNINYFKEKQKKEKLDKNNKINKLIEEARKKTENEPNNSSQGGSIVSDNPTNATAPGISGLCSGVFITPPNKSSNKKVVLVGGHYNCDYPDNSSDRPMYTKCKSQLGTYCEGCLNREFASLIANELNKMGAQAYMANAIVKSNPSVQVKNGAKNDKVFNKSAFSTNLKYLENYIGGYGDVKLVMEVHFDAAGNNAHGGHLTYSPQYAKYHNIDVEKKIVSVISDYLPGRASKLTPWRANLANESYFRGKGISKFLYLETEFYDNCTAMKTYNSNKKMLAEKIAKIIYDSI